MSNSDRSTFTDDGIAAIRESFRRDRVAQVTDAHDKSIWLVDISAQVGMPAILVAYEGAGAVRFTFDRPINRFRLLSAGFPGRVVDVLVELVSRVFAATDGKQGESPIQ
jgi:hypothetical protein